MKRPVLLVVALLLATGGLAQRFSLDFEGLCSCAGHQRGRGKRPRLS